MLKTRINLIKNDLKKSIVDYPLVYFLIICIIANWLFITNNFLYWDDWAWTGNSFKDYFYFSKILGRLPVEGLYNAFMYMLPPFVVKFFTMLLIYFTTVCLYRINDTSDVKKNDNIFICLLFMLNPIISIKHSICIVPYYICTFEFALASYLLICNYKNVFFRLFSLLLFFLSFSFNSLLVFYAVPFMYLFYNEHLREKQFKLVNAWKFIKKYSFFILIPFVFFVIKVLFLKPEGAYAQEGYNSIHLYNFLVLPEHFITGFIKSTLYSFGIVDFYLPYAALLFLSVYWGLEKKIYKSPVFIFIFLSFGCAVLPYTMVGKYGELTPTKTRHFFLVLYPIALTVFYMINKIPVSLRWKKIFLCFIIFSYIFENLYIGYKFYKDKLICESFIENIKENELIRDNRTFAFSENSTSGFISNDLCDYKLFGLFWRAFGDETRVAFNIHNENESYLKHYYNIRNELPRKISDITDEKAKYIIYFDVHKDKFKEKKVLKAYFQDLFKHKQYLDSVKSFSTVSVKEYE